MEALISTETRDEIIITESKMKLDEISLVFHPVRLMILKTLSRFPKILSSDVRKLLLVSWGKYTTHLYVLLSHEVIEYKTEIVDASPQKTLSLTEKGFHFMNKFRKTMSEFIDLW